MALFKNVNGTRIQLTPEEEAARLVEVDYNNHPDREAEAVALEDSFAMERLEVKGIDRAQFAALLDHENRIRALEGKQPVTAQQMKDWVKARL